MLSRLFKKAEPQKKYYKIPHASVKGEYFRILSNTKEYINKPLTAILGCDSNDNIINVDLEAAPHILLAGSTMSGKSVCINTMINSLLCKLCPDDLNLYIIDPKVVDFHQYKKVPHTKGYATEITEAEHILRNIISTMNKRYRLLAKYDCVKVSELTEIKLPNILIVFDEYASFSTDKSSKNLVAMLQEILRKGRAAGIHVILATQRPDSKVITGQIKANIPCRISFKLPSAVDSRTILDTKGAEQLRGNGDGIILKSNGDYRRFQGAMLSKNQCKAVIDYWKVQPFYK